MNTRKTVNRSATDRLKHLVRAELTRQELSDARAAREARLPGSVFQSLLRLGKTPDHRSGGRTLHGARHLDDDRRRRSTHRHPAGQVGDRQLTPTAPRDDAVNPRPSEQRPETGGPKPHQLDADERNYSSQHPTELMGGRAPLHRVTPDEAAREPTNRRQRPRPVVHLFDADVDVS